MKRLVEDCFININWIKFLGGLLLNYLYYETVF